MYTMCDKIGRLNGDGLDVEIYANVSIFISALTCCPTCNGV